MTEQITRPATLDDLKALLRSLNANEIHYLLIGGYALAANEMLKSWHMAPVTVLAGAR